MHLVCQLLTVDLMIPLTFIPSFTTPFCHLSMYLDFCSDIHRPMTDSPVFPGVEQGHHVFSLLSYEQKIDSVHQTLILSFCHLSATSSRQ